MAIIVFKPMKGSWHQAIINSVEFSEGSFWFKVDKNDCKEQLHFRMSDVEAYALTRDLLNAIKESPTNYYKMLLESISKVDED